MARVEMLQHISGPRPDDTAWPHIGEPLDCDETEARHLVSGGLARWPARGAERAGDETAATPAGDDAPGPENGSEGDGKPLVRDPKQAWIDHAVEQGAAPEQAVAMTKADLIAQYGNPA